MNRKLEILSATVKLVSTLVAELLSLTTLVVNLHMTTTIMKFNTFSTYKECKFTKRLTEVIIVLISYNNRFGVILVRVRFGCHSI